jgi:hypothetical protein
MYCDNKWDENDGKKPPESGIGVFVVLLINLSDVVIAFEDLWDSPTDRSGYQARYEGVGTYGKTDQRLRPTGVKSRASRCGVDLNQVVRLLNGIDFGLRLTKDVLIGHVDGGNDGEAKHEEEET